MPRDLPVGNGDLLVTFDHCYRIRDLYYPQVGRFNHTDGHVQRFGVWVRDAGGADREPGPGRFAWIEDEGWERRLRYRPETLVTEVHLVHRGLGLEIVGQDAVDFHEAILFRRFTVRDLTGRDREVRLFQHLDLSINGTPLGDTAHYDPGTASVILYKDESYFLISACDAHRSGVDHWAIGSKRIGGAEGTWRDAEDGELGRNPITQGSVDCCVGIGLRAPALAEASATFWIACGHSHKDVADLHARVLEQTPERMMTRTGAYWRLWCRRERPELGLVPDAVREAYHRSLLILRTQVDNGGAIVAANDTDITHFSGDHYSYCWMRDGALVAHALVQAGQGELSRQFFRFAERCIEDAGYFLHKYTPAGRLASSWHPHVIGGQEVLPIQQDETALTVWALRAHFEAYRDVEFIKPLYERLVARPGEWMLAYRDPSGLPKPSWDLWEERRGVHLFTVASVIAGLRAAAAFAEDFGERDRSARFRDGADRMLAAVRRHLWDPESGRYARSAAPEADGRYRLDLTRDAASFALFFLGVLPPDDPTVVAEMESTFERLRVRTPVGGVARYERDYYHQVETRDTERIPGNPWIICTLWRALYLTERAERAEDLREALAILEWAVARQRESGVLPEQLNPHTGAPLSVSPLTWSHATLVTAVLRYAARAEELRSRARPRVTAGSV